MNIRPLDKALTPHPTAGHRARNGVFCSDGIWTHHATSSTWHPMLSNHVEFKPLWRHRSTISRYYKTELSRISKCFDTWYHWWTPRPVFENKTCLLVFLKSCTVTLKHLGPAYFAYRSSSSGCIRSVIGWACPSIKAGSVFHWWKTSRRLWLSRYCCTKMAAELVEAMASRAWLALVWGENETVRVVWNSPLSRGNGGLCLNIVKSL